MTSVIGDKVIQIERVMYSMAGLLNGNNIEWSIGNFNQNKRHSRNNVKQLIIMNAHHFIF